MELGKVSAIMPTYNRSSFLWKRVREMQAQTYQDWELIIVDDGSTDDTFLVAQELARTEPRITKLLRIEHSDNVSIPRNVGVVSSKGEYIANIDDDCHHFPRKFEVLVGALESDKEAVLAFGDRLMRHKTGEVTFESANGWNPEHSGVVDNCQILYRRSVYDRIPLIFSRNACDYHLTNNIKDLGPFLYVAEAVGMYVWHMSNRSSTPARVRKFEVEKYDEYFEGWEKNVIWKI